MTHRKIAATLIVVLILQANLFAFDTFWHAALTGQVGKTYGFSSDAAEVMQFGNFSGPDFLGPIYDEVVRRNDEFVREHSLPRTFLLDPNMGLPIKVWGNPEVHKGAIFLHFDNLNGHLDSNAGFDYIFQRLLYNTQHALADALHRGNLNEGTKKILILMTLGASLHCVQDFYSHSNWIHLDLASAGLRPVMTPWGKEGAPTWFEVRTKMKDPARWPWKVQSGVYPPKPGMLSHTEMNHDNSQLFYEGISQISHHQAGPHPAVAGSQASAEDHQLYAVNSAARASIEWIGLIEKDSAAKNAIDYVKGWDIKKYNPMMLNHLEGSLAAQMMLSCLVSKWDGARPPTQRAAQCSAFKNAGLMTGMTITGKTPISFANEYWAAHARFHIVETLAEGISTPGGDYQRPIPIPSR